MMLVKEENPPGLREDAKGRPAKLPVIPAGLPIPDKEARPVESPLTLIALPGIKGARAVCLDRRSPLWR
jgi:hypothetical protein